MDEYEAAQVLYTDYILEVLEVANKYGMTAELIWSAIRFAQKYTDKPINSIVHMARKDWDL